MTTRDASVPADLWALVCADGGLHLWNKPFGADEIAFADATCDDGPHRAVRYVAAPERPPDVTGFCDACGRMVVMCFLGPVGGRGEHVGTCVCGNVLRGVVTWCEKQSP